MATGGWSPQARRVVNVLFALMCALGAICFYLGVQQLVETQRLVIGISLGFAQESSYASRWRTFCRSHFHTHDRFKLSAALLLAWRWPTPSGSSNRSISTATSRRYGSGPLGDMATKERLVNELEQPSRYLAGIDLGTTNSAVSYVDTSEEVWRVRTFATPQLVDAGQVEARETLPSCHYQPAAGELAAGALRLPWSREEPASAVASSPPITVLGGRGG